MPRTVKQMAVLLHHHRTFQLWRIRLAQQILRMPASSTLPLQVSNVDIQEAFDDCNSDACTVLHDDIQVMLISACRMDVKASSLVLHCKSPSSATMH